MKKNTILATPKKKMLQFGLYGKKEFLLPDFMHCETIDFRNKKDIASIEEHAHPSLFQVYFVASGTLFLNIEKVPHVINGPAIVTIPEKLPHSVPVDKNLHGKVLTLSTSFLETVFKPLPQALLELSSVHIITVFDKQDSFETLNSCVTQLYNEVVAGLPENKLVLQSYFSLVLHLIYRLMLKNAIGKIKYPDTRNVRYFTSFKKSIKQFYAPMRKIKQYAEEINITPVHLNRVCQAVAGKSASQIINDFFILEAQVFLQQTNFNISEIAYRLNFDDPAYFSRFFHKLTGVSPKQFREENG